MKATIFTNFYVRSGLFGVLSLIGAFFNYALYPILIRILSAKEFGDFATIVAISNQLLGIMLAFNIISIYIVKTQPENKAREYAQVLQKNLIIFFLGAVVVLLLLSPYLHSLLKISNVGSFIVLAITLVIAVPNIIWTGYLQGHKELMRIGGFNVAAAIAKLIIAVILAMSFGAIGGILGILIGSLVGLAVLRLLPGVKLPNLISVFNRSSLEQKRYLLSLKNYFLGSLFVVGSLSFLQNYDITLAKALFDPSTAGIYSGISILSNALYYVCFLLIWIILPEINIGDAKKNNQLLRTAYKLLGIVSVVTIVTILLLKDFITRILLGAYFTNQGDLLIYATLYQIALVAVALYSYYLLVNRRKKVYGLAAVILISTTLYPALTAQEPLGMIRALFYALVCSTLSYLFFTKLYRTISPIKTRD